jgi:uncharacterized protein
VILDAYTTLGTERETRLTAEELLRQMDRAGIDRAVVAPEDREIAFQNASGNNRILAACGRCDRRFLPACTVNPWSGEVGCRELRRAADRGALVLVLAPGLQGFCPADDVADPLMAVAAELGLPVYVHTGQHSYGAPTQLVLLAARHPRVRFVMGHCGSTDYAHDMAAVLRAAPDNLWFELSLVRPWAAADYVRTGRRERFLFGSSAPRNDPAFEISELDRHLLMREYPDVYGENLLRLVEHKD